MSRAPNVKLTDIQWDALRAAWETGVPNRTLAAQWGVDESSIRYRARTQGWVKDLAAIERIQAEGQARTLEVAADPALSRAGFPHPAPRGKVREDALTEEDRARLREERVEAAVDVIAESNLRALAKAEKLDGHFDRISALLGDLLTIPDESDPAAVKRRQDAANVLLAGRTDSVSGSILALAKLAESVQGQRRKALGADDRPKQVQLTGANGGPIETAATTTVTGGLAVNYAAMSTAELEALLAAATVIEGRQERPAVPVPPGDPEG